MDPPELTLGPGDWDHENVNLSRAIRCVRREIRWRKKTLPRLVSEGAIPDSVARYELAAMRSALRNLLDLRAKGESINE